MPMSVPLRGHHHDDARAGDVRSRDEIARRHPGSTAPSALPKPGAFWRYVFVPLYRRVPWEFKRNAMRRMKMIAQGWPEDARRFGEPWRPPAAPRR
jgi:hypothetical protein